MRIDIKNYNKELMRAAFEQPDDTLHSFLLNGIEIPFTLAAAPLCPESIGWMRNGMVYMLRSSKQMHRGGHVGTLAHEAYHWAAMILSDKGEGEWQWAGVYHPIQEALYGKWKEHCGSFYAGSKSEEMGAEVFRVLQGFSSGEEWEQNTQLLEDWKRFFMNSGLAPFFS